MALYHPLEPEVWLRLGVSWEMLVSRWLCHQPELHPAHTQVLVAGECLATALLVSIGVF